MLDIPLDVVSVIGVLAFIVWRLVDLIYRSRRSRFNGVCRYHRDLVRLLDDCLSKLDAIKRKLDDW
jgi:hypothetical protein